MLRSFLRPCSPTGTSGPVTREKEIGLMRFFVDYSPMVSPTTSARTLESVAIQEAEGCKHPRDKAFEVDYFLTCTACGAVLDDRTIAMTLDQNTNLWGQVHSFVRRLVVNRNHRKELFEKTLREMLALEAKAIPTQLLDTLQCFLGDMGMTVDNKSLLAILKHHLKETNRKAYYNHLFKIAALLGGRTISLDSVSMEKLRSQFAQVESFTKERKDLYISSMQYVIKRLLELNNVVVHYRLVISETTRRSYDHKWQELRYQCRQ